MNDQYGSIRSRRSEDVEPDISSHRVQTRVPGGTASIWDLMASYGERVSTVRGCLPVPLNASGRRIPAVG